MASGDNAITASVQGIKIKQEKGITPVKTDRLTSFKLPRDLTLGSLNISSKTGRGGGTIGGASNTNKKVFVPNLNVVRNKNADVKTSRDTSQTRGRNRNERGAKGERGRGRGRGNNTLIQTAGLFSEGAGTGAIIRRSGGGGPRYNENDTGPMQLRKPTINKREPRIDLDDEQKHIDNTIPNDVEDDLEEKELLDQAMPVILTEQSKKSHMRKIKIENLQIKRETEDEKVINRKLIKIKQEKTDDPNDESTDDPVTNDGGMMTTENASFSGVKIKSEFQSDFSGYPATIDEFFSRKKPQIFLLQLPDTLPGRGPDIEPAESAEFERPTTPDPSETFCTLKQLEEGNIGKIVRYKSGKTKLILGETRFDMSLGMDPGFLQELISINTNNTERSGNMINLGEVQAKLNASPDWEYILSKSCL